MPPPRTVYDDRGRSQRDRERRERDRDWSPGSRALSRDRDTGGYKPSGVFQSSKGRAFHCSSDSRESQGSSSSSYTHHPSKDVSVALTREQEAEARLERRFDTQEARFKSLLSSHVDSKMNEIKDLLATVAQQSAQLSPPRVSRPSRSPCSHFLQGKREMPIPQAFPLSFFP